MSNTQSYMLDTNAFNRVLDGKLSLSVLRKCLLIATGIQRDELSKTPDAIRRAELLHTFDAIDPEIVPTASFAFDIDGAGWDQACWNDGSGNVERMRQRLKKLDGRKKSPEGLLNQERDILIAETVIKTEAVLVSSDANLRRVVVEFGGQAFDPTVL